MVVMQAKQVAENEVKGPSAETFSAHCASCLGCEREAALARKLIGAIRAAVAKDTRLIYKCLPVVLG
jgi:hypothetical protein